MQNQPKYDDSCFDRPLRDIRRDINHTQMKRKRLISGVELANQRPGDAHQLYQQRQKVRLHCSQPISNYDNSLTEEPRDDSKTIAAFTCCDLEHRKAIKASAINDIRRLIEILKIGSRIPDDVSRQLLQYFFRMSAETIVVTALIEGRNSIKYLSEKCNQEMDFIMRGKEWHIKKKTRIEVDDKLKTINSAEMKRDNTQYVIANGELGQFILKVIRQDTINAGMESPINKVLLCATDRAQTITKTYGSLTQRQIFCATRMSKIRARIVYRIKVLSIILDFQKIRHRR